MASHITLSTVTARVGWQSCTNPGIKLTHMKCCQTTERTPQRHLMEWFRMMHCQLLLLLSKF
jgi:hypothetical protein